MKVCVIGLRGLPGIAGGVETHCEQLYPRLQAIRRSDEFMIIGRKPYMELPEFTYKDIRIVPLFAVRNKYLEAISNGVVAVLHARFKMRAEIVHIHAIGPALVAPLAKLLGMKVVITHHGDDYNRSKWNRFAQATLRAGEYLGVMFCDQMIHVSASVMRRLESRFPDKAATFQHIPNGANHVSGASGVVLADQPDVIQRHGLAGLRYVACVGRMVPEKCFEDAISAFEDVADFDKLVIAGGAEANSSYLQKLREMAGDRVVFTGPLSREDVDRLLTCAALFILPSSHEGLPIVALEAIAAGVPVLLSNIEPNLDLGLPPENFFRLHDLQQLAYKMRSDLEQYRIKNDLGAQYDWHTITCRTSSVYDRLISAEPRRTRFTSMRSLDFRLPWRFRARGRPNFPLPGGSE
jgi:glycosyltransferase involved in cell wall biosynthesis